ncbi:MAG: sensor histidine kinase [Gemmatimonadaceae bacterium]
MEASARRFWFYQIAGWSAYAVAMILSRLAIFPLRYMAVAKVVLTIMGLLCSLVLWRIYRHMVQRQATLTPIIVVSVVASYLLGAVWTAADNVADIPISAWLLDRRVEIRGIFGLFVGSVYNAFTLLAWSLLYFAIKHHDAMAAERERALRAEAMAQRAQLDALRYQIHPHFLFNTLNVVSTLVAEGRTDDANRMIARLSDFLRLTLSGPPVDEVSLSEEMDFVRRYLDIEQVRFADRLQIHIDVDAPAWNARVPYLLLQPLVENAVKHGIAAREAGGRVSIAARRDGNMLRLVVEDDGPGWVNGPVGDEHIGLTNTRERLRRLYGDAQHVRVDSDERGARVSVAMPFRTVGAPT